MTAAVDAEACAVVATAADIICSLRAADLAGWTPPWRKPPTPPTTEPSSARDDDGDAGEEKKLAWPAVARGKRSRSRRGSSPSGSGSGSAGSKSKKKARRARGSPASPLDYSAGSGASTSGGEDGAFCSPPVASSSTGGAGVIPHVEPASKVGLVGRRSILPVPPPRPTGQRPRKKMRLPEIQQMVRSLSVENDALRQEMEALQKACTALSKENGKLETRLDQSNKRDGLLRSEEKKGKPQAGHDAAEHEAQNGFELPDLNLPAHDG